METLRRNSGSLLLAWSDIEVRQLAEIEVVRDLRLVLPGPGLRRASPRRIVAALETEMLVSAASRWEIASQGSIGKLEACSVVRGAYPGSERKP